LVERVVLAGDVTREFEARAVLINTGQVMAAMAPANL
jgi:hypothetical protein